MSTHSWNASRDAFVGMSSVAFVEMSAVGMSAVGMFSVDDAPAPAVPVPVKAVPVPVTVPVPVPVTAVPVLMPFFPVTAVPAPDAILRLVVPATVVSESVTVAGVAVPVAGGLTAIKDAAVTNPLVAAG